MKGPSAYSTFVDVDAWLLDRGWTTSDPRKWQWRCERGNKVTIATYPEAIKIQRRRDQRAGSKSK